MGDENEKVTQAVVPEVALRATVEVASTAPVGEPPDVALIVIVRSGPVGEKLDIRKSIVSSCPVIPAVKTWAT
jgi:hypothetical protein